MKATIPLPHRATRTPRRSPAQWRALVDAFAHSGETRKQFCLRHGLVLSTFDWWQRRVREQRVPRVDTTAPRSLFVELSAQSAPVTPAPLPSPWDVELELGAGVVLRMRRGSC